MGKGIWYDSMAGEDTPSKEVQHVNNDHSRTEKELWPYGDPIEPTDEHARGVLAAMTRAAIIARKRALARDGYVWMEWKGKFQRVSDPMIIFPDGMDEDALHPRSVNGGNRAGTPGKEVQHVNNDHSRTEEELWPYGDPIEPTDEHARGALAAMTRAAIIARKRALARDGYVWMEWKGKFQRVSDPMIIFPDGMDEDALRPRSVIGERS